MKQILLTFFLILISVYFYGQVSSNSTNHYKAKINGVNKNNNDPSLKETVDWIAEKLRDYVIPVVSFAMEHDTLCKWITHENSAFFTNENNDTLVWTWIGHTNCNVSPDDYKVSYSGDNPIYPFDIGYVVIPLKDITEITIAEINHYYHSLTDTSRYPQILKITNKNAKRLFGNDPKAKYAFLPVSIQIAIDFSKKRI